MTDQKVLENKVRRMAARQGLRLMKSRRRDPNAWDYGTYMLVDLPTNIVVFADWSVGQGFGLDLDEVATFLLEQVPIPARVAGRLDGEASALVRLVLEARGVDVTAEAIAGVLAEISAPEDAASKD